MSRALGTFEKNWTLDCVCDECNMHFANTLELALGRDSREALFRIDLGLKPASGASELLNRRIKTTLQDPGPFDGVRVLMTPSEDGTAIVPAPVPQVGFRREDGSWRFLIEKEITPANVEEFKALAGEIRIHGVGPGFSIIICCGFLESTVSGDQHTRAARRSSARLHDNLHIAA